MAKQDNTIWWILGLVLVFIIVFQSGALKRIGLASTFGFEQNCNSETDSSCTKERCEASDGNWTECGGRSAPLEVCDPYQTCECPAYSAGWKAGFGCDYFVCALAEGCGTLNVTEDCGTVTPHIVNETNIAPNECCIQQNGCGSRWEEGITRCVTLSASPPYCPNGTLVSTGTDVYGCSTGTTCVQNQTISECQEGEIKYSKCGEGEGFKQFIDATCSNGEWAYVVNVVNPCIQPCLQGYDYINQNCIKNETLPPTCPEDYVLVGSTCTLQQTFFQQYMIWFIIGGIILLFGYLLWEKGEGGFFRK